MKFSLSSDQTALLDNVTRYCTENYDLKSRASILSSPEGFSRKHWATYAELGWLGAAFPEDVGGTDGSTLESSVILGQFGRHLVAEPYWAYVVFAGQLINFCASPQQRRELLAPIVEGKLLMSVAHGEFESHGNIQHVTTTASKQPGGYLLKGRKSLVFGGPNADKLIVSARIHGNVDSGVGISLFIVDRDASGLTRRDYRMIDGTPTSDLALDNVLVTESALLGPPGGAIDALQFAHDHATVALCAEAVGAMDGVLWTTRDYLRLRRQYGITLNTLQALQHRMADMFAEVELSRSILFRALSLLNDPNPASRHIGALSAKVHVGQSGKFVCKNGVQLHGGLGMTEEHIVGQYFKRVSVISNTFGTLQHQINECVELLTNESIPGGQTDFTPQRKSA